MATATSRRHKATPPAEPKDVQSIWGPIPIGFLALTGEFSSGKTLFGLTIDPKNTLCYDNENSSETYTALGFHRIDVAKEMLKKIGKGKTYKPIDRYEWWLDDVRKRTDSGNYTVVFVDPFSEFDIGMSDYVFAHPESFGKTKQQFTSSGGMFWGAVKDYQEQVLDDLRARCQTFAVTLHMRNEFRGATPTGKREPKGKETLFQLATLYLQLERNEIKTGPRKGEVPAVPSAILLKHRLTHISYGEDGELSIAPILPPRIPIATPKAIREYLANPADYNHLKKEELLIHEEMSEEEKLRLQLQVEQARRDANESEISRTEAMARGAERQAAARAAQAQAQAQNGASDQSAAMAGRRQAKAKASAEQAATEAESEAESTAIAPPKGSSDSDLIDEEMQQVLRRAAVDTFDDDIEGFRAWMRENFKVEQLNALTYEQANLCSARLVNLKAKRIQEAAQASAEEAAAAEGGELVKSTPVAEGTTLVKATRKQLDQLKKLIIEQEIPDAAQDAILSKRGVKLFKDLTTVQADEIIQNLEMAASQPDDSQDGEGNQDDDDDSHDGEFEESQDSESQE